MTISLCFVWNFWFKKMLAKTELSITPYCTTKYVTRNLVREQREILSLAWQECGKQAAYDEELFLFWFGRKIACFLDILLKYISFG